jgi:cyclophilin family peptidyl-prolyl cis-trans isomerase
LSEAPKAFEAGDPARGSLPLLALAQSPLPDLVRPLLVSLRQATRTAAQSPSAGLPHHGKGGALRVTNVQALQRDLGRIDCRLAAAQDRIDGRLQAVRDCGFGQLSEAQRLFLGLSALPEGPHFKERVALADLTSALSHPNPSVRLAAVNALGETGKPEAAEAVRPFLSSDDLVLAADAAAAAGALHDTQALPMLAKVAERVRTELPEEAAPVAEAALALDAKSLVPEFQKWLLAPHQNLRIQAAKVLSTFEHRRVEVPVVPQPDRSFAVPPAGTVLRLATEGGVIDVRLRPDLAPQTSGNFAALAKKGYFKDLTFHRIVPDFVVQGGDPRGDGEGGPGYTLPCEVGPLRYARGVVGVALSGKDTGGSQLFVTTSPQPHLDGRYTAFGEVVSGMEVVDALLEGERILEVSVVPPTK